MHVLGFSLIYKNKCLDYLALIVMMCIVKIVKLVNYLDTSKLW